MSIVGPAKLIQRAAVIREICDALMTEGIHYGKVPGTNRRSLLQPGAETLAVSFRLGDRYELTHEDLGGGHRIYQSKCSIYHQPTETLLAEAIGVCSTMEEKYRWVTKPATCPACGADAIIKSQQKYGGGYVCWKKKDGCGQRFPDDAQLKAERVERDNPADLYNTVAAMAQKRAKVRGIRMATGASDIFTDSVDDHREPAVEHHAPPQAPPTSSRKTTSSSDDAPKFAAALKAYAKMRNVSWDEVLREFGPPDRWGYTDPPILEAEVKAFINKMAPQPEK